MMTVEQLQAMLANLTANKEETDRFSLQGWANHFRTLAEAKRMLELYEYFQRDPNEGGFDVLAVERVVEQGLLREQRGRPSKADKRAAAKAEYRRLRDVEGIISEERRLDRLQIMFPDVKKRETLRGWAKR